MSSSDAAIERIALLERLQTLHSNQAISDKDFASEKARILAGEQDFLKAAERPILRLSVALVIAVLLGATAGGLYWLNRTRDFSVGTSASPSTTAGSGSSPGTTGESATNPGIVRAAVGAAAVPSVAACYMNECGWFRELGRERVAAKGPGVLYRLTLLWGSSHHASAADYPRRYRRGIRIEWNAQPDVEFVLCSKELPAVFTAKMPAKVTLLDFVNGPPGASDGPASVYWRTCHGTADWGSANARSAGYKVPNSSDVTVSRATDILTYLR